MAGRFERKKFSDCSLEDRFFDSLKEDYPEFCDWFSKKQMQGKKHLFLEMIWGFALSCILKKMKMKKLN